MGKMDKLDDHKHAKKGKGCFSCCAFLFAVAYAVFYGIFAFNNPDKVVVNGNERIYECCASSSILPEGLDPNQPFACPDKDPLKRGAEWNNVDVCFVSERFDLFFLIMFIINIVTIGAICLATCGLKNKCIGCIGGTINFFVNIAALVMLILGGVWRWSHSGRVCSGDV